MDVKGRTRVIILSLLFLLIIPATGQLHALDEMEEETLEAADSMESQEREMEEARDETGESTENAARAGGLDPDTGDHVFQDYSAAPEASVFTGAATNRIPIAVPPGRGVTPTISLNYNSSWPNRWAGLGWDLRMGAIQRATKRGVDYSKTDFMVLTPDSSFELAACTAEWPNCKGERYVAKIEGAFSRYDRVLPTTSGLPGWVHPAGDGSWIAATKDGTKYYYGSTSGSRQENGNGTFKWLLDRVEDTVGNYMTIEYAQDAANGEVYLSGIDYTKNGPLSATYHVDFLREARSDAPTLYTTLSAVKTASRLKTIKVLESATSGSPRLVSRYELTYQASGSSKRSLLSKVTRFDGSGAALPPVTLHWTTQNRTSTVESMCEISNAAWLPSFSFNWGATQWLADFHGGGKDGFLLVNRDGNAIPP